MSNLNENFKVRKGLTVTTTISAGSCVEADSFKKHGGTVNQFLKADGSVDSSGYTTNTGTVTCVSTGPYLTGGASTTGEIGIDSACSASWNAKTTCTGTTTPSNTQTFTNKSGSNSQWTNDAGYTCNVGDVTGIDAGTAITVTDGGTATPSVGVTSSCNTAWNNKTTCTGTVTCVSTGPYLTGGASTAGEIGIDSACASKWDTAAAGDISAVTTSSLLSGGGTTGAVEVGIDSGALDYLNQSACAGINCTGTTTASNSQTFTNKSGNISQWNNDSGYTCNTGNITCVSAGSQLTGGGSSGTATLNVSLSTGGVGAGTYGDDATGCKIDTITVDEFGRVTAVACGTTGDITGITAGNGLSGGATSGTATLALDGSCLAGLNQSACPGIDCTGTTTASNTQTFTNKSGSNSQWTNDAGYTCNTGTVTSVTRGNGINGSGSITSTGSIAVGAGTGITVGTNDVSLAAACRNALASAYTTTSNLSGCAGLDCTGTTTASNSQTFTNKGGSNNQWTNDAGYTTCTGTLVASDLDGLTCCTGTTTASNTQTFTNKSGSNSQWTNDEGYTCNVGDITGVTAGAGLSGGGTSGAATVAIDGVMVATLNQSGCAGINCTGTTTASNSQTFTNKSGNISQWTNDSGYTCNTGTTTASNTQTFTNKSGNISQWTNDSGYTTCTGTVVAGDISSFTSCTGTTTPSNTQTFTNKSGSNSQWTNDEGYTDCLGDITAVTVSNGIAGGGTSGSVALCVDSTVVRTTGNQTIGGVKTFSDNTTIQGDLTVNGDFTCINTVIETTSAVQVDNNGTGPALCVNQCGANDIVNFLDDGTSVFYIEDGGNVGIGDTNPGHRLDVGGNINVTGSYKIDDSDVINSGKCFVGSGYAGGAIGDTYISSAATWNAKTTCTGTVDTSGTPVDNDFAKFTDANTIEGRSCSEVRTDLGINSAANCTAASLDQSACAGILCTGTTTASNTQTFTNKSGNISQWTNDAGYLTAACEGTLTGIDAGTAITVTDGGTATPTVGVTSACNTAWNAKTTCTGTVVAGDIANFTCCTGTTTPSNTQTFTNKSGSNSQWTNDEGYTTCNGDITAVTTSNGIAGGGTSGSVGICVDSTVIRTTGNQVVGGTKHFTSTIIGPSLSATGTVSANCFAAGAFMEVNASAVEVYPQGTLLALNSDGEVVESTEEESTMVFGVATGDSQAPIVLGAEPICITGCITAGDFITASSCKGHGKKSTSPYPFGTIIAQAMESGGGDSYEIKAMIRKM